VHVRLALAALVAAVSGGCAGESVDTATVERVIDGDTIVLATGEKIRYLLVDAPETTNGHDDCYGANAAQFNTDLVLHKQIELTYDVEKMDMYGRTLAWVTVDGNDVNKLMVERGYACVLFIKPDGMSRYDEFKMLQADAKANSRGVWGACDPLPPAC
jgi:micrococcal nuclease